MGCAAQDASLTDGWYGIALPGGQQNALKGFDKWQLSDRWEAALQRDEPASGPAARQVRQRADLLLTERGLAESRARAQALILAGKVFSGDRRVAKAGDVLAAGAPLEVRGQDHPWVSRGGLKLDHALRHFGLSPEARVCLDIGASTGGFTDVLLASGAARVHAVDVGHGQLAWKLRSDPRVVVHERTNARHLAAAMLGEPAGALVCDASFIGLRTAAAGAAYPLRARRLGGGADQAAIRGRAGPGRQQGRGPRSGGPRSRLCHDPGVVGGTARLGGAGHRAQPDHRAGRQPRVPDRGAPGAYAARMMKPPPSTRAPW